PGGRAGGGAAPALTRSSRLSPRPRPGGRAGGRGPRPGPGSGGGGGKAGWHPTPRWAILHRQHTIRESPSTGVTMTRFAVAVAALGALLAACSAGPADEEAPIAMLAPGMTPEELEARVARFAPAAIDFDDSVLEPWEKQVLVRLVEASDIMHELFMKQVSPQNAEWRERLASQSGAGADAARALFDIMIGPWDRLEHDEPFLDVGPKPAGAGYYPADLTREQFEQWLTDHPEDRQAFTGYFSVLKRQKSVLVAVPYNVEYRAELERAAALLNEAADLSQNESLSNYLRTRAAAFLSNDYFESDMAWM